MLEGVSKATKRPLLFDTPSTLSYRTRITALFAYWNGEEVTNAEIARAISTTKSKCETAAKWATDILDPNKRPDGAVILDMTDSVFVMILACLEKDGPMKDFTGSTTRAALGISSNDIANFGALRQCLLKDFTLEELLERVSRRTLGKKAPDKYRDKPSGDGYEYKTVNPYTIAALGFLAWCTPENTSELAERARKTYVELIGGRWQKNRLAKFPPAFNQFMLARPESAAPRVFTPKRPTAPRHVSAQRPPLARPAPAFRNPVAPKIELALRFSQEPTKGKPPKKKRSKPAKPSWDKEYTAGEIPDDLKNDPQLQRHVFTPDPEDLAPAEDGTITFGQFAAKRRAGDYGKKKK